MFAFLVILQYDPNPYEAAIQNLKPACRNLEGGSYKQVPALSTTRKTYLDYGFLLDKLGFGF